MKMKIRKNKKKRKHIFLYRRGGLEGHFRRILPRKGIHRFLFFFFFPCSFTDILRKIEGKRGENVSIHFKSKYGDELGLWSFSIKSSVLQAWCFTNPAPDFDYREE